LHVFSMIISFHYSHTCCHFTSVTLHRFPLHKMRGNKTHRPTFMRSLPTESKVGNTVSNFLGGQSGHATLKSGRQVVSGHIWSFGVPRVRKIAINCPIWQSSDHNGRPRTISANTVPTDHMSTHGLYTSVPSSISGALYHRVMTCVPYGHTNHKCNLCARSSV
jgi:hypothetical protein